MKYYIKLVTGFREDQFTTIPMREAHKAYYLFRNPEQRGVFDNGLALVGSSIKEIRPDWNATMGWNPNHRVDSDDFNEINGKGFGETMNTLLEKSKQVSDLIESQPSLMKLQLKDALELIPEISVKNIPLIDDLSSKFKA